MPRHTASGLKVERSKATSIAKALHAFEEGTLKTGIKKNRVVTKKGQAIAIGAAKFNARKKTSKHVGMSLKKEKRLRKEVAEKYKRGVSPEY